MILDKLPKWREEIRRTGINKHCPRCMSQEIDEGSVTMYLGECTQENKCNDCRISWKEYYSLSCVEVGWEIIYEREKC